MLRDFSSLRQVVCFTVFPPITLFQSWVMTSIKQQLPTKRTMNYLTSFWVSPGGAHSYVMVSKVGSFRETMGLVMIMRFLL